MLSNLSPGRSVLPRCRGLFAPGLLLVATPWCSAAPDLAAARMWSGDPTGAVSVALSGPITTEARAAEVITLWISFDEAVTAYRRVEVFGATLDRVGFTPGRNWMTLDLVDVEEGADISATVVDAVSADGVTPRNTVRIARRDTDFYPDAQRDINDILVFAELLETGDLRADGDLDGRTDINDVLWFGGRYDEQAPAWGNGAPIVSQPADGFAPQGKFSRWIPFTVRDDVSAESDLAVTMSVAPGGLLPPHAIQTEGTGAERRIRFFGGGGSNGVATVTLNVSDGDRTATTRMAVRVGPDTAPTARIHTRDFLGVAPLTAEFSAAESSDEQGNIARYAWTVGNTDVPGDVRMRYTFTQPGTYRVNCRVTDDSNLSTTATRIVTVAASPYAHSAPVTAAEARRFLWQAAFGPTDADVAHLTAIGYDAWLEEQFAEQPNYFSAELQAANDQVPDTSNQIVQLWDDFIVEGRDQLRQRMAWALIQTIVIDTTDSTEGDRWLYNLYIKHALGDPLLDAAGNYRELLDEITYSAAMGDYLTYRDNKKADVFRGTSPDENYAREVMQLFTVGLWLLEPDGTRARNIFGDEVPTYDAYHVSQLARVFTGLVRNDNQPAGVPKAQARMRVLVNDHEYGDKFLLDYPGVFSELAYIPPAFPSATNAWRDIRVALDSLVQHPSFAPFIAERMIKRFVTSNPTRGYIRRVGEALAGEGPYGTGVRGDMRAMMKAILLDDEARNPVYRANPMYGRVLEPQSVLAGAARVLGQVRYRDNEFPFRVRLSHAGDTWNTDTAQGFMRSPSVFNFFRPDYAPAGTPIDDAGFSAPELQIYTSFTAVAQADQWRRQIIQADADWDPALRQRLLGLAPNPSQLVTELERMLVVGGLTAETKTVLVNAITGIVGDQDRVRSAVYLIISTPEFRVLR